MDLATANYIRTFQDGDTFADRAMNDLEEMIASEFETSPSYRVVAVYETNEEIGVQIYGSSSSLKIETGRNIILKPDAILNVGNMFNIDDDIWIVTEIDQMESTCPKGYIQKCNHNLIYVNSSNITISIPCIAGSKVQLGSLISRTDTSFVVPVNTIRVVCSSSIGNDLYEGMRFVIGRNVYSIANIDDLTYGIFDMRMERSEKRTTDDFTTGIASQTTTQIQTGESTIPTETKTSFW